MLDANFMQTYQSHLKFFCCNIVFPMLLDEYHKKLWLSVKYNLVLKIPPPCKH